VFQFLTEVYFAAAAGVQKIVCRAMLCCKMSGAASLAQCVGSIA
jgi:hypothetical protein